MSWRVFKQVFWGTDRPLTPAHTGAAPPTSPPDAEPTWYVRHDDQDIDDTVLPTLVAGLAAAAPPGLSLASCAALTDAGLAALSALPRLVLLDLFNTRITDAALTHVEKLTDLRSLVLAGTRISDAGVARLRSLTALDTLHLGWTAIGDAGLAALEDLPRLRALSLRGTKVSDVGLASVARLRGLDALDLQETAITDAGLAHLLALRPTLTRLHLGYTRVTDASLATLRELTNLRTLLVRGAPVRTPTPELYAALPQLAPMAVDPEGVQEGLIR